MSGFVGKGPGKATEVRYIGMFAEVVVPKADSVWVKKGDTITVPAELAASLCEQVNNWELVKTPKPTSKKKTAPVVEETAEEAAADEEQE